MNTPITDEMTDQWVAMARERAARHGVTFAPGAAGVVVDETGRCMPDGSGQCCFIGALALGESGNDCGIFTSAARVMGVARQEVWCIAYGFDGGRVEEGLNPSAYAAGMRARRALLGLE